MRYSWLFPIAFVWRHFSNEEFWTALEKKKAVLQNQRPNFACMESTMRAFAAQGVSYHGGLFYSGSALTQYRFPSAAKPPDWTDCPKSMDFIAREVLALKIVWHVAETFLSEYDALQSKPTRQCWKACTEAFLEAIRSFQSSPRRPAHAAATPRSLAVPCRRRCRPWRRGASARGRKRAGQNGAPLAPR